MPSVQVNVAVAADDWQFDNNGSFMPNKDYAYVGRVGGVYYYGGWRFASVTIPAGAIITNAYIRYYVQAQGGSAQTSEIWAEDSADPAAPTDATEAWASYGNSTTAQVNWNVNPGTTWKNSPDITTIIQELVDSYDYSAGAAMIIWENYGGSNGNYKQVYLYDKGSQYRAELHISYVTARACEVTIDGTTYGFGSGLLDMDVHESTWGSYAWIRLDNYDGSLNSYGKEGDEVDIDIYNKGAGYQRQPFFVKDIQYGSEFGHSYVDLYCVDSWFILDNMRLGAGTAISGETMKNWVQWLFEGASTKGQDDTGDAAQLEIDDPGFTLDDDATPEDVWPGWEPQSSLVFNDGQSYLQAIRWIMRHTSVFLRPENSGNIHARNLETTTPDFTYTGSGTEFFIKKRYNESALIPNEVNTGNKDASITGQAQDSTSITAWGRTFKDNYMFANIDDNTQADNLATGILSFIQNQQNTCDVELPNPHASIQVYDYVRLNDSRSGEGNIEGNVSYINYRISPGRFECKITLGGTSRKATWPDHSGGGFNSATSPHQGALDPLALRRGSIPPDLMRKSVQPYTTDINFSPTDWNTITWSTGKKVYFADGTQLTLQDSSTIDLGNDVTTWFYFDVAQQSASKLTIKHSTNYYDAVGNGRGILAVAMSADSTGDTANEKAFVWMPNGMHGYVNALLLTAKCIKAEHLEASMVIASTIIAGTAGAARVQIDSTGITGYDSSNNATFVADATDGILKATDFAYIDGVGFSKNFYNGIFWETWFETLDGYDINIVGVSTADETYNNAQACQLYTGAVASDSIEILKLSDYEIVDASWDKDRRFKTRIYHVDNTNQTIYVGLGDFPPNGAATKRHMGIRIVNATLVGTCADGTTQSTTGTLKTIGAGASTLIECVLDATAGTISIYLDGASTPTGTLSTNIPTGVTDASKLLHISLQTDAAANKELRLSQWYMHQLP